MSVKYREHIRRPFQGKQHTRNDGAIDLEVKVNHKETLISFLKQVKKIKPKTLQSSEVKQKSKDNQKKDPEEKKNQQNVGETVRLFPSFSSQLKGTVKYLFNEKTIVVCFWKKNFEWNLASITGLYNYSLNSKFANYYFRESDFEEITGSEIPHGIVPKGDIKARVFKLNIQKLVRHILMKEFNIILKYCFSKDADMKLCSSTFIFDVPYFKEKGDMLEPTFLGHYNADNKIITLFNYKFKQHPDLSKYDLKLLSKLDQYQREKSVDCGTGSSTEIMRYALNIEDLSTQDELKEFTLTNIELEKDKDQYSFWVKRYNLPENFKEMTLCLVPMAKYRSKGWIHSEEDCIFSQIKKFNDGKIHFEDKLSSGGNTIRNTIDMKINYSVRFIPNRITYRACLKALSLITIHSLEDFFKDFEIKPLSNRSRKNQSMITNFECFNKQIAKNEEQMTAIRNIVNCTAYPFPYVVFGPPGTGKTSCLVECIAQILKHKPRNRIIITAQSNSACDEIGVRLLKYISATKIYRFYSPSLLKSENKETSDVLRRTSNLRDGESNQYPTDKEFRHFRVVIATLTSCSRIIQLNIEDVNRHFDYIFVDECAAATESEAMVPIMGLGTHDSEITANIVLFGDHKQLGPVIKSDIAARLGLDLSLMERIMSKRRYQMNPLDMSYDKNFVVQLLDNYRSHPAILQFSNVLFYNSKLRAKLGEPEKSFATRWKCLNNKKFPILFHCVKTPSKIIHGGTSSFNVGEIKIVRFYLNQLLKNGIGGQRVYQRDIGIVSPYKAQLNMLEENLCYYKDVEIGTAEYYQGREKKIILISTVKSRDSIGFVRSERRLNVCITRAKSLLIVVGNADTLQQDSLWNSFMHFCKANDGCCGEKFNLKRLTDKEQKVLSELNKVLEDPSADDQKDIQQPAIERAEEVKAIQERMQQLEELMKRLS